MTAILVTFLFFIAALSLVIKLHPLPLAGASPITLAGIIALETVSLDLLDLLHLVTPFGVFSVHLLFLTCWYIWIVDREKGFFPRFIQRLLGTTHNMLSKPVILLLLPATFNFILRVFKVPEKVSPSVVL